MRGRADSARRFTFASARAERQIQFMPKHGESRLKRATGNRAVFDSGTLFEPAWRWLVVALGVATLTLALPALWGAFLINPQSDQYIAGYGFRTFAASSLRDGSGFPQWNPYMFGGLPYVAAMHGDIFYPTFLLRLLVRTDVAMTWGFVIHTFLAGAFTLGFLRAAGISRWPSVFGAIAYLLSGPIASYASPGHDGKLFVSALLPLSLWMLTRAIGSGKLWTWGVFALAVGLAVLSPHPQLLQYFLLVSGAYALLLVWQHTAAVVPAKRCRRHRQQRASGSVAESTRVRSVPSGNSARDGRGRVRHRRNSILAGTGLCARIPSREWTRFPVCIDLFAAA